MRSEIFPSQRRASAIFKVSILVTITLLIAIVTILLASRSINPGTIALIGAILVTLLALRIVFVIRSIPRRTVAILPKPTDAAEKLVLRRITPRGWERAVHEAKLSQEDRRDLDRAIIHTPRITNVSAVPLGLAITVQAISGQAPEDIRKRIPNLASALAVPLVFRAIGARTVECIAKLRDPLAQPSLIQTLPDLDTARMAIQYGVREDGEPAIWTYANTGGAVAGGLPGAGKTTFATLSVGPLLISPYAEVHILDGKGGMDWNWAKPVADFYTAEVRDLEPVAEHVESLLDRLRDRVSNIPDGQDTNFWHRPPTLDQPFVLLVIDECQSYFNTKGMISEQKKFAERITAGCEAITRLGRSAGFFAFFMTQKPTADSIPTSIRDNCGPRICFQVSTRQSEEAVLGEVPSSLDDPARATQIPKDQPGRAVITEGPRRLHVRASYLPETKAHQLIKEIAS